MFVQRESEGLGIWRIPGPNMKEKRNPEPISHTNPMLADHMIRVSPSGQTIAFASTRSGTEEVWTSQADGSHPMQLTRQGGTGPAWSPDGQRIVFVSIVEGKADIYVVDAEGGEPKRLTTDPKPDNTPSWSHDGRWIYFATANQQIRKVSPEGEETFPVARRWAWPHASAAGEYVYYMQGRIWRVPSEGGEEVEILEKAIGFDIVGDRLYYGKNRSGGGFSIHYLDLKTGIDTPVRSEEGTVALGWGSIAVSPDDKWIYYAFGDTKVSSDIMLIENFR